MNEMFEKLLEKLKELFQLNQPELDFGIYRIMHAKSNEITKFLEQDLLPQVKDALSGYQSVDRARVERELDEAINQAKGLGVDPDSVEKVKTLRAQLADAPNAEVVEAEVYEALYKFFRRYYTQGDFLSRRVYKKDVYAIPYEGEEVALHWANKDQYYIKSSEILRDYAFRLRPEDAVNPMRVHFRIVGADEEEHNTVKTAEGKQRVFILAPNRTPEVVDGELHIFFRYEQSDKKQSDLNEKTAVWFKASASKDLTEWKTELLRLAPIKSNESRTLLEKHLEQYTARNTFDYFIHKDLGGFLRRELDFFIKNEIMHLDDIEDATAERADQYLAKIKAIRVVAGKIVAFLAELEDFQKKLWLKKKFIYGQHYLVPISLIPLELRDAVSGAVIADGPVSAPQKKSTAKKKGTKGSLFNGESDGLLIDTSRLDDATAAKVISSIENMHEAVVGDLIHSENFSALSFIQRTYSQQVGMIYIDPPFNLAHNGDFLYRTDYKDSTWTSLLHNRLSVAKPLLDHSGWAFVRCDVNGNFLVRQISNQIFGSENFHAEILVQRIRKNVTGQGSITLPLATDSLFLFGASQESELHEPFKKLAGVRSAYWRRIDDSAGYRNPPERTILGHTFYPYKADAHFKYSQKSIDEMLQNGRIRIRCAGCGTPQTDGEWSGCKGCGHPRGVPQYLVEETDRQVLDTNWTDIAGYSHTTGFSTENSLSLLKRCVETGSGPNYLVLDFFAGSGTTGHAVMELNAEKAVSRRFILVEVGSHFDSIVIPRLAEASKDLHNSGVIRVLRLEQYEDTLNNLEIKRPEGLDDLFFDENSVLREEYMLRYMLDVETRGSASLLNAQAFMDPRKYSLRVKAPGSDETVETPVDLLETFNWLLGLRVRNIAVSETFGSTFTEEGKRLVAELTPTAGGPYWFRQVSGVLPDGREALIVWRTLSDDAASDEAALLAWFESKGHLVSESLDVIYTNGDCNLGASKPSSASWSVESLEAHFHELMFEGSEG